MSKRGSAILIFALIGALFSSSALAEKSVPKKAPVAKALSPKPKRVSCGLHLGGAYLTGEFDNSTGRESFVRDGLRLGTSCNYYRHRQFSLGAGMELYAGQLHFNHEEFSLKGSATYLEFGFKEWLKFVADLRPVKMGVTVGIEKTNSTGFRVNSVQMMLGGGWFDFKEFAAEHLSSRGSLEIWEVGLDFRFPFRKNYSFTFGALWQRYHLYLRVDLDDDGRRVLEALYYNPDNVDREFKTASDFFYLTPGLNWCKGKWCASLVVPWGVFKENKWSWGTMLTTGVQF